MYSKNDVHEMEYYEFMNLIIINHEIINTLYIYITK